MKRGASTPRDDAHSVTPSTTRSTAVAEALAPTTQSSSVQSSSRKRGSHERKNSTNPGKRKRSRSQMTTSPARQRTEEADGNVGHAATMATKRHRAAMEMATRPNILEQSNSDDDGDTSRVEDTGPPPPPAYPVPFELLCRYPNKPCPQERATKKHGELHSYCAYHRLKAQEYQRTLERKKRERRLLEQRSPSTLIAATTISSQPAVVPTAPLFTHDAPHTRASVYRQSLPSKASSPPARRLGNRSRTRSSPPRPSASMYSGHWNPESGFQGVAHQPPPPLEPFQHPVTLQEDDIQLLQVFLMDQTTVPRPTVAWDLRHQNAAHGTAMARTRAMPRSTSEGNDAYTVNLDGFTFTADSL